MEEWFISTALGIRSLISESGVDGNPNEPG
jgi:hypothetical protein